jgi:hypothetical protein
MNGNRARLFGAFAVTAALLVPLAVFGGPALARSTSAASQYQYSSSAQYQYGTKVTICHLTGSKKHSGHTITISSAALKAHLKQGGHLGACTGTETKKSHAEGNDDDQGENDQGHGHGHGHGK